MYLSQYQIILIMSLTKASTFSMTCLHPCCQCQIVIEHTIEKLFTFPWAGMYSKQINEQKQRGRARKRLIYSAVSEMISDCMYKIMVLGRMHYTFIMAPKKMMLSLAVLIILVISAIKPFLVTVVEEGIALPTLLYCIC